MYQWLLEYDSDNEIYTLPSTDDAAIARVVGMFDGRHTFYCCLSDAADDSCLWCVGEPDRRLVEGRLIERGKVRHFVLHRPISKPCDAVIVRHGFEPTEVVKVASAEVLTRLEVTSVFRAFHNRKEIPSDYESLEVARLFGSNSFAPNQSLHPKDEESGRG